MSDNPFFEKYAKDYAVSRSHEKGSDLGVLSEMIGNGRSRCLDVATGTGFTAASIASSCDRVIALDETEAMIGKARDLMMQRGIKNVEFVHSSFEDYRTKMKFDAITIRRALHHFSDKNAFFRKAFDLLETGGILAIADMLSPAEDINDNFNTLERTRDKTHIGALKQHEFLELFSQNHFADVKYEVVEERLKFAEWLYPVDENSETGINCRNFLKSLSENDQTTIGYDSKDDTITKKRIIITGRKP